MNLYFINEKVFWAINPRELANNGALILAAIKAWTPREGRISQRSCRYDGNFSVVGQGDSDRARIIDVSR